MLLHRQAAQGSLMPGWDRAKAGGLACEGKAELCSKAGTGEGWLIRYLDMGMSTILIINSVPGT